ncbi:MAG: DUF4124 domain-containing protein [Nitrospirota bacterium]|nr:DUF4124 domain-containing protein [Nitrospirota bacterium]
MFPTRLAKYAALLLGGSTLALLFGTNFQVAKPPPMPDLGVVPAPVGLPGAAAAPTFAAQRIPEGHAVVSPGEGDSQRAGAMTVYKWIDDEGEWHYSNTPPKGVTGAITQQVVVHNLVSAEQAAVLAGVDPSVAARTTHPPDPGVAEKAHSDEGKMVVDETLSRFRRVLDPVTGVAEPLTEALEPVIETYRNVPQLVDDANKVAEMMEQHNRTLEQINTMGQ